MSSFEDLEKKRWDAKKILMFKRDRVRAAELALEALELLPRVDLDGSALAEVHHNMSALFRDLDDLERCEPLARRAVELERADRRDDWKLGNYELFLAMLLHDRGKHAEAAAFARDGVASFERHARPNDPELAMHRSIASKIIAAAGAS